MLAEGDFTSLPYYPHIYSPTNHCRASAIFSTMETGEKKEVDTKREDGCSCGKEKYKTFPNLCIMALARNLNRGRRILDAKSQPSLGYLVRCCLR